MADVWGFWKVRLQCPYDRPGALLLAVKGAEAYRRAEAAWLAQYGDMAMDLIHDDAIAHDHRFDFNHWKHDALNRIEEVMDDAQD